MTDQKRPLFSIITPARNRPKEVTRCILSVKEQGVDSEHIVIDDASIDNTAEVIASLAYQGLVFSKNPLRVERAITIQRGIDKSTGQWLMTLGSDDVILPGALKRVKEQIEKYPEAKCFHFGWRSFHKDGRVTERLPREIERDKVVSGLVAAGSFVFHRDLLKLIPPFPHTMDCYSFADQAGIPYYSRFTRTLGNPWGDDFYLFYWITRHVESIRVEDFIMGIHQR